MYFCCPQGQRTFYVISNGYYRQRDFSESFACRGKRHLHEFDNVDHQILSLLSINCSIKLHLIYGSRNPPVNHSSSIVKPSYRISWYLVITPVDMISLPLTGDGLPTIYHHKFPFFCSLSRISRRDSSSRPGIVASRRGRRTTPWFPGASGRTISNHPW